MTPENLTSYQQNLKVLVADDEVSLLKSITFALKGRGFKVATARTGAEAFIEIRQAIEDKHPYDLLLLDVKMPKISGTELLSLLQKLNINMPVIVMSNYNSQKQVERMSPLNFLSKPFSIEELIQKIKEVKIKVTPNPIQGV